MFERKSFPANLQAFPGHVNHAASGDPTAARGR